MDQYIIPGTSHAATSIVERADSIVTKGRQKSQLKCDTDSVAGCVSQRACVYCGARVVLNPVTDAIHLVHGPIGCASYTWDIRGSLSSGSELYRNSFSTDLKEQDIIFGGEKKLARAIDELVAKYSPELVFVYSTCIVGVIGDDMEAVCNTAARRHNIKVIPIQSSGFAGNKSAGYRAACDALLRVIEPENNKQLPVLDNTVNFLGDFNLAGETWIIKNYLKQMGIEVLTALTGDSTSQTLKKAAGAALNIIQCAGSMVYLAGKMKELYQTPYFNVSFLGIEDTAGSLRKIAEHFSHGKSGNAGYIGYIGETRDTGYLDDTGNAVEPGGIIATTEQLIKRQTAEVLPRIMWYREKLKGKRAAIYVGGGFKAISLVKQFKELGIDVVMVGTQTGRQEEYELINQLVDEGTVVLDDANPAELEQFMMEKGAHLLVGGVKERPLAYKLGVAFIDHNHDRKHPLSGFAGAVNFASEVYSTLCSPVWKYV